MKQKQFKDACDICGQFDYCQGYQGKVCCPHCIEKDKAEEKTNGQQCSDASGACKLPA